MNPKRYRAFGLPLALAIGAGLGLSISSLIALEPATESVHQETPAPALAVRTLIVERAEGYAMRRVFTGEVEASRTSRLGFERGGLLKEVLVREGDSVKKGRIMAWLDQTLLESKRRELEASLNDARANQALAAATLERYRQSVDNGAVTRQALDEAREGARAALARVDVALARLQSANLDIAKSELRAPFEGIVTRRLSDEGSVLTPGDPVFELQESAIPEIRVGIAGILADTLQPGDLYKLSWRGEILLAHLRTILPLRNLGTRTLDALFVPVDPPGQLRPGELVELPLSHWVDEGGLWLPLSALANGSRGLWQVYVTEPLTETPVGAPSADHRIEARPVEVLYQEGDRVYVRGPFADGDQVICNGLQRVVPGQFVRALTGVSDALAMGTK